MADSDSSLEEFLQSDPISSIAGAALSELFPKGTSRPSFEPHGHGGSARHAETAPFPADSTAPIETSPLVSISGDDISGVGIRGVGGGDGDRGDGSSHNNSGRGGGGGVGVGGEDRRWMGDGGGAGSPSHARNVIEAADEANGSETSQDTLTSQGQELYDSRATASSSSSSSPSCSGSNAASSSPVVGREGGGPKAGDSDGANAASESQESSGGTGTGSGTGSRTGRGSGGSPASFSRGDVKGGRRPGHASPSELQHRSISSLSSMSSGNSSRSGSSSRAGPGSSSHSSASLAELLDLEAFGASRTPLIIADDKLTITAVNDAAVEFFGYESQSELVSMPVVVLIPTDSEHHRRHPSYVKAYKKKGRKKLMDTTRVLPAARADGSTFMVEISLSARRIGDNPEAAFVASFRKATGLIAHFEHLNVAVLVADSSLCVTSINSRCLKLLDRPRGSVIGRDVNTLVPHKLRRVGGDFLRKFIANVNAAGDADEDSTSSGSEDSASADRSPTSLTPVQERLRAELREERRRKKEAGKAIEGDVEGVVELGSGGSLEVMAAIRVDRSSVASHYFITLTPLRGAGRASATSSSPAPSSRQSSEMDAGSHATPAAAGADDVESLRRQVELLSAKLKAAESGQPPASPSGGGAAGRDGQLQQHQQQHARPGAEGSNQHGNNAQTSVMTPAGASGDDQTPSSSSNNSSSSARSAPRFHEISLKDIKVLEKIGSGGFAKVYRGLWMGKEVALKKLRTDINSDVVSAFLAEMNILANLRHPNIVLMLGACRTSKGDAIVTEFLHGGSLYHYLTRLNERGEKLAPARMRSFALDIAHGVSYLHSLEPPIIHRDLKSLNVLIGESLTCKVADFGLSREMVDSGLATGSIGSPHWISPEALAGNRYTAKVDVYSFAVVLWEMATTERPFAGMNPFNLISMFLKDPTKRLTIPEYVPDVWRELIEWCWAVDPSDRPTFRQIVKYITEKVPVPPSS